MMNSSISVVRRLIICQPPVKSNYIVTFTTPYSYKIKGNAPIQFNSKNIGGEIKPLQNGFWNKTRGSLISRGIDRSLRRKISTGSSNSNNNTNDNRGYRQKVSSLLAMVGTWYSNQLDTNPIITKSITSGFVGCIGDLLCQALQSYEKYNTQMTAELSTTTAKTTTTNPSQTDMTSNRSINSAPYYYYYYYYYYYCQNFDWNRTVRFCLLGTFLVGPVCHTWYGLLATRIVPAVSQIKSNLSTATTIATTSAKTIIKRVLVDQTIFAPVFLIAWTQSFQLIERMQKQYNDYIIGLEDTNSKITADNKNLDRKTVVDTIESPSSSSSKSNSFDEIQQMLYVNWLIWIPAQAINFKYMPIKCQVLFSNVVAVTWNVYLSYATSSSSSSASASASASSLHMNDRNTR